MLRERYEVNRGAGKDGNITDVGSLLLLRGRRDGHSEQDKDQTSCQNQRFHILSSVRKFRIENAGSRRLD